MRRYDARVDALVAKLNQIPGLRPRRGTWDSCIRRELSKKPARQRRAMLACFEQWSTRQAEIYLSETPPPTDAIQ